MLPYLFVFLSVSILGLFIDFFKNKHIKFIFLILSLISFVSLYYLRDSSIGTDTSNYIPIFNSIINSQDVLQYSVDYNIEVGFSFFVYFISFFTSNPFFIFLLLTSIIYFNLLFSFSRYNLSYALYFASFFSLFSLYFFSFNILRQCLAISFLFVAITFLLDSRNKMFLLFCFFAFLFHYSSIFIFLFYFIYKFKKYIVAHWYFFIIFTYFSFKFVYAFIFSSFAKYASYDGDDGITKGNGILLTLFYLIVFVFSIFLNRMIKSNKKEYEFFVAIYIFYISLSLFFISSSFLNQGLVRVSLYFMWPVIFILLIILKNIKELQLRFIFNCLFWVFLLIFMVYSLMNAGLEVVPYKFRLI